ncbi:Armadillo repeat-containing protein 2 [Cocos nucifera]|nr:Armadillo repeat-containing protein 2 [Cocos nucifera]
MGLNVSKRVERSLRSSPEFDAACGSIYDRCLADAQHAFPGVRLYQLASAAAHLHAALSVSLPLVRRWVPSPPAQAQVDAALRRVDPEAEALGPAEFRAFAAELFKDAILAGAGAAVLRRVPIGVAGIAGVGMVTHAGAEVVGRVMGVYAAGVVAAVFLGLS